jgi:spore germination cell wall hydrolase CwlJ-like protein
MKGTFPMTHITFLACLLYLEAGSESLDGKCLVADTLANRARTHGTSPYFEARRKDQYSAAKLITRDFHPAWPLNTGSWRDCLAIAAALENGTWEAKSNATHYYAPARCREQPKWAKGLAGIKIGNHIFFTLK